MFGVSISRLMFVVFLNSLVCQSTLTLYLVLSTSTCTYADIDIEINVWSIDIEINVCIVFLNLLVCLFVCGFTCDIATGHTNEATIMKFGMKGRYVKF